jgi:beta-lactamase class A
MNMREFDAYSLTNDSRVDARLQAQVEEIDAGLRSRCSIPPGQTAVGVLDLRTLRLALVQPDRIEYAASIPKLGILLAYFQMHPSAAADLSSVVQHELGLMIKASSNEMATKFSRELGLSCIQQVLDSYRFYDSDHGGGIWMGKHYGESSERIGDPIGGNSHAATVRQLLRFYLLLEQGKLVSTEASAKMRDIFLSPDIPNDAIKFVKGLEGRNLEVRRKWGSWQDWLHDSAVITGPNRHYILVGLTHHPKGDDYLADLAAALDDWLTA